MKDFQKPLHWGMTYKQFKELYEKWGLDLYWIQDKYVRVSQRGVQLHTHHPGDCGVLLVKSANYADAEIVQRMHEIATKCGFSKMFATVVGNEYKEAAEAFMNHPLWTCVHTGKSNRSLGHSDEWVLVYYNPNCEYKGH